MSCGTCHSSPCTCSSSCDATNESTASQIANFVDAIFGSVTKTCVNNQVQWTLPCDLDTAALTGYARLTDEGLMCYLVRVLNSGFVPPATIPTTTLLWVDVNRTDSYTEDGSIVRPFKTIMGAINEIIANADTRPYQILIAPGTYAENVVLENVNLRSVSLIGLGSVEGGVRLNPASGNAVQSNANNTNLRTFQMSGISISDPVVFIGADGGETGDDNIIFKDCIFDSTISMTGVDFVEFWGGYIQGASMDFTNCAFVHWVAGTQVNSTTLALTDDPAQPAPDGYSFMFSVIESTTMACASLVLTGSNIILQSRCGSRIGLPGTPFTVPSTCTFQPYNSFIRSDLTIAAGATLANRDSEYEGALVLNGTLTSTLWASAVLDFGLIAANGGTADLTIAVTNCLVGDTVILGLPAAPTAGIVFYAFVSAAGTVTVSATNCTGAGIDPASATYRVKCSHL